MTKGGLTYSKVGVDIDRVKKSHRTIAEMLRETFQVRKNVLGRVVTEIGHYAGLIELKGDTLLALHTDGVGTKTIVASNLRRYDTVGIDCVAMNVNDLICLGAEPIAMLDYLAIDKPQERVIEDIMQGLVVGARQAGIAIVGGETAVMPELINGFDLAAMSIGVVKKKRVVTGEKIQVGDVIYGMASSGIHSNGLTLARRVLLSKYGLSQRVPELNRTIGEELLEPTRIYVRPVLRMLKRCEVHGLAHITGGAFSKLRRLGHELGFQIDEMPEPHAIFKLIQRLGKITNREMYRTFNMGVGFCVIAPRSEEQEIVKAAEREGCECHEVGKVTGKEGVTVKGVRAD